MIFKLELVSLSEERAKEYIKQEIKIKIKKTMIKFLENLKHLINTENTT